MNDSVLVKRAILEAHVGEEVTAVLTESGQTGGVFQGTLLKETLKLGATVDAWVILSPRGIVNQRGAPVVVPETKVFFAPEQLAHLVVRQETQEEAQAKVKEEAQQAEGQKSRIVGPGGGMLQ